MVWPTVLVTVCAFSATATETSDAPSVAGVAVAVGCTAISTVAFTCANAFAVP